MELSNTSRRWQAHFDVFASGYDRYRRRYRYYWKDTVKYLNFFLNDDNDILQIGSSTGNTLAELKGNYKTGIDFSSGMINQARKNYPELDFRLMDAHELNLDRKYDVVVLSNVVSYLDNILEVLLEVKKHTHERSKIFIVDYNKLWQPLLGLSEFLGLKRKTYEQNWLTSADIENLLYLAGFETYRKTKRMLLPINIPIVSYVANRILAKMPIIKGFNLCKYVIARPAPDSSSEPADYSVSVIIPARNESGNIERAILETPEMGKWTELIFVEGNSTDDTWDKILEMQKKYSDKRRIKVTQQEGKGKYDAVKKGFDTQAEGDILMILDADLTVPPFELQNFYNAMASSKGDFINGSRLVYPMESRAMRFLNILGNKFFSYCFTTLLEQPIKDTLCGTKVIFKKDYQLLAKNRKYFGDFDPFGDFDLLFGAYKLNLKIIDLPIRYRERTYGSTNISRFRHGLILLRMVFFALRKIKLI